MLTTALRYLYMTYFCLFIYLFIHLFIYLFIYLLLVDTQRVLIEIHESDFYQFLSYFWLKNTVECQFFEPPRYLVRKIGEFKKWGRGR